MNKTFFEPIYDDSSIKKEGLKAIIDAHTNVAFLKNEIILEEGKISNEYYLIEKGLFRSYVIDYKGYEISSYFLRK